MMKMTTNLEPEATVDANPLRRRGEIPSGHTVGEMAMAARMMMHSHELEREVVALREDLARIKRPKPIRVRCGDPIKLERDSFISKLKAQNLNGRYLDDRYIAIALDNSEFEPLADWTKATGLRLWSELFDARKHGFPLIQRTARKYLRIIQPYQAMQPAATGKINGNPHKQGARRISATDNKEIVLPAHDASLDCGQRRNGTTR
jgi:hypothetical protein